MVLKIIKEKLLLSNHILYFKYLINSLKELLKKLTGKMGR